MHINNTAHRAVGGAVSEALRTLFLLSLFVVGFLLTACEKDLNPSSDDPVHTQMQALYTESTGLTATSADSVINYYEVRLHSEAGLFCISRGHPMIHDVC